ncbi:MAG: NDP-hexose 2,3-dehydratase family protein [Lachnospiraceae bacterium]|nr:NDP-hexose 2,3-dehydratase family protein [Lachnospiraceae bacterium]
MNQIMLKLLDSWSNREGNVNSTKELLDWIQQLNETTKVEINETSVNEDSFWFYDDYRGEILNRKRSFFSIVGVRYFENEEFVTEQPIILQKEIGYLGIIAKEINGVLNFLMQAKIEPGNVNCVQISPTIQATKSNFTRAHGGRLPFYFEYFEKASQNGKVLYDQIQSEQGSRFDGKRNRNIILLIDKEIPVYDNYRWMTLGQIKELMAIDNLVNMDTRTVLSGIPFVTYHVNDETCKEMEDFFKDKALMKSIFVTNVSDSLSKITPIINDYKMFCDVERIMVPLNQLVDWKVTDYGIHCKKDADFSVGYYDIHINGREVQHWLQPLFKANKEAMFALFTCVEEGVRKFLITVKPEIGCFDKAEFGPTIQEGITLGRKDDIELALYKVINNHLQNKRGIMKDVILSEEGGRFYHEQNRNVIIEIEKSELPELPANYVWVDYCCLNYLVQVNNVLNIQLRNLMSLIDL